MIRIVSWLIGFSLGAAVAAVLVALFVPIPSNEIRRRLREGYQETMTEARLASQQRRAELEAELYTLQGRTPDAETPSLPTTTS